MTFTKKKIIPPDNICLFLGPSFAINIRSEGCNDPTKTPNTCGLAYINVDDVDRSPHGRGHNVVVLDAATGNFIISKNPDKSSC